MGRPAANWRFTKARTSTLAVWCRCVSMWSIFGITGTQLRRKQIVCMEFVDSMRRPRSVARKSSHSKVFVNA